MSRNDSFQHHFQACAAVGELVSISCKSEIPADLVYMYLIYKFEFFFVRLDSKVPTFAEWLEYCSFPESFWLKL